MKGFVYYQPIKGSATHLAQLLTTTTILKLKLKLNCAPPELCLPITLPSIITHLDITGISVPVTFVWPPSLHTLVIGQYFRPIQDLPEGLQVLKLNLDLINPFTHFLTLSLQSMENLKY
jgi:hypothetical protein